MKNKITYTSLDKYHNLTKNQSWWIPAIDMDSYNYIPQKVNIEESIKEGIRAGYIIQDNCQLECDRLNSL